MNAKAVYFIRLREDYVELFSESLAGTLDFVDSVAKMR